MEKISLREGFEPAFTGKKLNLIEEKKKKEKRIC